MRFRSGQFGYRPNDFPAPLGFLWCSFPACIRGLVAISIWAVRLQA
nr:MAG TPA: hypothetical protein [Caudoviricetes sp.]